MVNEDVRDKNVVFAIGPAIDGVPVVLCGITQKAWDNMQNGLSSDMDLTKAGYPFRLILFGAKSHEEIMSVISSISPKGDYVDLRHKDFKIEEPKKN